MQWRLFDVWWWLNAVMSCCRICHHDNRLQHSGRVPDSLLLLRVWDNSIEERGQTTQNAYSPFLRREPRVWIDNQRRWRHCRLLPLVAGGVSELVRLSNQAYKVGQKTDGRACHERWTTLQQHVQNDQWIQSTHNTSSSSSSSAEATGTSLSKLCKHFLSFPKTCLEQLFLSCS